MVSGDFIHVCKIKADTVSNPGRSLPSLSWLKCHYSGLNIKWIHFCFKAGYEAKWFANCLRQNIGQPGFLVDFNLIIGFMLLLDSGSFNYDRVTDFHEIILAQFK